MEYAVVRWCSSKSNNGKAAGLTANITADPMIIKSPLMLSTTFDDVHNDLVLAMTIRVNIFPGITNNKWNALTILKKTVYWDIARDSTTL